MKCGYKKCDKDVERLTGTKGRPRKYCSIECMVLTTRKPRTSEWTFIHWVLESRDCEQCGALYVPIQLHQKFCSKVCNRKRHDEHRKTYLTPAEKTCQHCVKVFQAVNAEQLYCSRQCKTNATRKRKRQRQYQRIQDGIATIRTKNRKGRNRDVVQDYKTAHGCKHCGEAHPACLDFHHRDPKTKLACISELVKDGYRVEVLLAEIAKCDLLCANCHRKLEYNKRHNIVVERLAT